MKRPAILALVLALMMVFALAACGDGGKTPSDSGTTESGSSLQEQTDGQSSGSTVESSEESQEVQLDPQLVLSDGQAWIGEKNGLINGYVFKSDGTYSFHVTDTWILQSSGTWSTSGNTLELSYEGKRTYILDSNGLMLVSPFGDAFGPFTAQAIPSGT